MRKVYTLPLFFIFCFTLLVTSCSKDGDGIAPCTTAWATDLQNELTAVIEDVKANPPEVVDYTEAVEKGFAEEDVTKEEQ
jgi:hypothetical protein